MKNSKKEIEKLYQKRFQMLNDDIVPKLKIELEHYLKGQKRIDRVSVRAKSVDRFVDKAMKLDKLGGRKYNDPIHEIQDQVGARIVVFYLSDVDTISDLILKYYTKIEETVVEPDSEKEFGYVGRHFILLIPDEIGEGRSPKFFELQIKTLFQHSWGECEHDLVYKPKIRITTDQRRRVAYAAAQAWGADQIFEQLFKEIDPPAS